MLKFLQIIKTSGKMKIIILCLACLAVYVVSDCPENCECNNGSLVCTGWSNPSPPIVRDGKSYFHLDLSFQSTSKDDSNRHCFVSKRSVMTNRRSLRSGNSGEDPDEGAAAVETHPFGSELEQGRLPAVWFGSGRFVWLRTLRMRGAGVRLIHKDAFHDQLKLTCVDVSENLLQRMNVFTWYRHTNLLTLAMNDNPYVVVPEDGPFLYSKSLENLFLSSCNITSLNELTFSQMPKLQNIDLSGNKLSTLGFKFTHFLRQINIVELTGNKWICDCALKEAWEHMKKTNKVWIQNMKDFTCIQPEGGKWNEVLLNGCQNISDQVPSTTIPQTTLVYPEEELSTRSNAEIEKASSQDTLIDECFSQIILLNIVVSIPISVIYIFIYLCTKNRKQEQVSHVSSAVSIPLTQVIQY